MEYLDLAGDVISTKDFEKVFVNQEGNLIGLRVEEDGESPVYPINYWERLDSGLFMVERILAKKNDFSTVAYLY